MRRLWQRGGWENEESVIVEQKRTNGWLFEKAAEEQK
jgi:hypothetical protein